MIKSGTNYVTRRMRLVIETSKRGSEIYLRPNNDNARLSDQERFDRAIERELAGLDIEHN